MGVLCWCLRSLDFDAYHDLPTCLQQVIEKKKKAENLLQELEQAAHLKAPEVDKEGISEEERYMLRKVGLRMKAFLLMGELESINWQTSVETPKEASFDLMSFITSKGLNFILSVRFTCFTLESRSNCF